MIGLVNTLLIKMAVPLANLVARKLNMLLTLMVKLCKEHRFSLFFLQNLIMMITYN